MRTRILYSLSFLLLATFLLISCNTTKRLKENEYLLVKNEIKVLKNHKEFSASDLESLIQQQPNKKFLGIVPIKLIWNGMFKNSGEPPVVVDKSLIDESKTQMEKYLNNSGFYGSVIMDSITPVGNEKRRKRKVVYNLNLSKPYRIQNIDYNIPDTLIFRTVMAENDKILIDSGQIFNSFVLDKERSRITEVLNNNGYFDFTKDYIFYEADSSLKSRNVNLTLNIRQFNPMGSTSETKSEENHKIYHINNIYIRPDYIPYLSDTLSYDTLERNPQRKNQPFPYKYYFIYRNPLKIKPQVVSRSIFLDNDKLYNATDVNQSYKKLSELRLYKYVDIKFERNDSVPEKSMDINFLDCYINLTRNPVHSYSIETQVTNSGGDLGIGGYLVYSNKNIFRGAEVLSIRLKGAMEAQESTVVENPDQRELLFFNTFEAGIDANIYIPKFLAPINPDIFNRYFRPKTNLNMGYNWQDRIEYNRIITNLSFGYEWSETQFKNHILIPFDINVVKVQTTPEFDSILATEPQRYRDQYTDHLILGLKYSYIFNNQELGKAKNFMYFRGNFEMAGNLLNIAESIIGNDPNEEGYRTVFGIRYSQFAKTDFDIRYYITINKKHSVALRSFLGVAIPYGNSIDIPFEKGYYGGGANGLRAWPLRYLGPGSYKPSGNNIERVGDLMLEANAEYRFKIYRFFTGAVFYDIGNIWLLSENETFPGGKFEFKSFASELAMDVGVGVRLDFSYFIFRIDFAQRLKDPELDKGHRWVPGNKKDWFNLIVNLGIGYPF